MEHWDFQGSRGGATVRQDYAKMMMISLKTAAQKAIFSTQPRRSTKRSESAGHVFLFVNTVRSSHLAAQRSTLAYCRTALTRRLWTFYVWTLTDWCANASGPRSFLGHYKFFNVMYNVIHNVSISYKLIRIYICTFKMHCVGLYGLFVEPLLPLINKGSGRSTPLVSP